MVSEPPFNPEHAQAAVEFENIPKTLKSYDQWVCWRYEEHPSRSKPMKTPYSPSTGERANIHEPTTWDSFPVTAEIYTHRCVYDGIGFVLTREDTIVGIDIDDCIDGTGVIDGLAREVVGVIDSYTEISPSGRGLRIFAQADLGDFGGRRRGAIELYNFNRYLTVTGHHLEETPSEVQSRLSELRELYRRYFKQEEQQTRAGQPRQGYEGLAAAGVEQSDEEVLDRMFAGKLGQLYRQIYTGDISEVRGHGRGGEPDESRADVLLFNALAFYTYQNEEQMRRILMLSPRAKQRFAKWNKAVKGETTYLEYQIADSLNYTRRWR